MNPTRCVDIPAGGGRPPGHRNRWALRSAVMAGALAGVVLLTGCSPTPGGGAAAGPESPGRSAGHTGHDGYEAPPAAPLRAGERFVNLDLARPYQPVAPAGGTDEYRCFLVDPGLTADAYLTGSQFLPQNTDLVHHAIVFRVDPDRVAAARARDDSTPGDGWTCFGGAGLGSDAAWVAHWAPGADETLLAPGTGYQLRRGGQLVLQLHYNLLATGGQAGETDQSGIRLRVADGSSRLAPLVTELLPAPVELPCPPGESGGLCDRDAAIRDVIHRFGPASADTLAHLNRHCTGERGPVPGTTQHCDHPVPSDGTVHAVAGHMHLLGRSIRVELNPGTPGARVLLDLPAYDFDQQAVRPLAEPVPVRAGDTYRVTCTHDATLRRRLPQLRELPPRYVVWADGTSDEMCLGLVVWSRPG